MKKRIYVMILVFVALLTLSSVWHNVSASQAQPSVPPGGFDIITNLSGLNLINHDLTNSTLLQYLTLNDTAGNKMAAVAIVSSGENITDDGHIFNDAGAIELYYFARNNETAVESVIWSATADIEEIEFFSDDSDLSIGAIRASADHGTAYLTIIEEMADGSVIVCFYIAQNVPSSNGVILLDIVLHTYLWNNDSDAVLAELSELIGINLSSYLP